ncbi:MAG: ion transporter [Bdellovibrionales bacterium]|nr:ion transporter [Bdellovibrionales bacterium]
MSRSKQFRDFITFTIVLAGVLVGLETYPQLMDQYGTVVHFLDSLIIGIFVVEIAIRIGAYGNKPYRFFLDPWSTFDFLIVAVCLLPYHTEFVAVLRLARVLRVLRLVSALPRLQFLVGALLKSIPSIGYISILLLLLFYIYACLGTFLFRENDPLHFGNLQTAMITLFQVVTLEGWNEIMNIQIYGSDSWQFGGLQIQAIQPDTFPLVAPLYFISFILVGTMIILNLFIGVIMNGMAEMQAEESAQELAERRKSEALTIADEIHLLLSEMDGLRNQLDAIKRRLDV